MLNTFFKRNRHKNPSVILCHCSFEAVHRWKDEANTIYVKQVYPSNLREVLGHLPGDLSQSAGTGQRGQTASRTAADSPPPTSWHNKCYIKRGQKASMTAADSPPTSSWYNKCYIKRGQTASMTAADSPPTSSWYNKCYIKRGQTASRTAADSPPTSWHNKCFFFFFLVDRRDRPPF